MRKRALSMVLAAALVIGLTAPGTSAQAAAKTVTTTVTLTVGAKKTLTVKKGNKKLKLSKWKSSNKKIVTVNKGKITGKKAGKAKVTAVSGKTKIVFKVTVKAKKKKTATTTEHVISAKTTEQQTPTTQQTVSTTESQTTPVATTESQTTQSTTTEQQTGMDVTTEDKTGTDVTTEDKTGTDATTEDKTGTDVTTEDKTGTDATTEDKTTEQQITEEVQKPTTDVVEWSVSPEPYEGLFSAKNDETGETENFPIKLLRKYVSFDPWPTTTEQVEYVIKNCKDPYVIMALYIVALDNMEKPDSLSDTTNITFDMLDALQTGAGAISGTNYVMNNFTKQHINQYWSKTSNNGEEEILTHEFASRTFLKGATPYNNYTPEDLDGNPVMNDKSKWQIIVDQYPYCFDQDQKTEDGAYDYENMKYITLCPRRYTEEQDEENGPLVPKEHSQIVRIGARWNSGKNVWLPTAYTTLNTDPGTSALTPYDVKASILFSNDYKAPQVNQGWNSEPETTSKTFDEKDKVTWKVTKEPYEGMFSAVDEEGNTQNYPIQLLRKYVSFDPWPTTDAQVEYIIKNCKDPYVIASLYVVALDNMEEPENRLSDYTNVAFDMLDSLQTGAGELESDKYLLSNKAKQLINDYWYKTGNNGEQEIPVRDFASRAYLRGATPYNEYTPTDAEGNSVLEDKTKWEIIVDQYPYCFDQDRKTTDGAYDYDSMKFITLCPRRYSENQDTENGPLVVNEHSEAVRIGFRWNNGKQSWFPTMPAVLNTDPGDTPLQTFDVTATPIFSDNYKAPQVSQGWNAAPETTTRTFEDADKVAWKVTQEPYEGMFSAVDDEGNTQNYPIQLLRKYVSFDPWPTTDAQVEYIIKNCKDPYVIAALYIVALDNMEQPDSMLSDYTNVTFDMLDSLQTGAGELVSDKYLLSNKAKQLINEYWSKTVSNGVENIPVKDFASRAYLRGATPYNGYTPTDADGNSVLEDKTKWEIIVDQYPYCFDQDQKKEDGSYDYENMKFITLCPRRYSENQDTEGGPLEVNEHSQAVRIGFRWNNGKQSWIPTMPAVLNTDPGDVALTPFDVTATPIFSNNYKGPQEDQGW